MGRAWTLRDLGQQETYMASSALFELGIKANAGERVVLNLDVLELLDTLTTDDSQLPSGISTLLNPDSVRSQLGSIGININDLIQIGAAAAFGTAGITPQTDPALYALLQQLELGSISASGTNQVGCGGEGGQEG